MKEQKVLLVTANFAKSAVAPTGPTSVFELPNCVPSGWQVFSVTPMGVGGQAHYAYAIVVIEKIAH
jgi:hypothetical protein